MRTDDEAMPAAGVAIARAAKHSDRLIRMYLSPQNDLYIRILTNDT
ncbi:MAG: hypothetical protein ACYTXE_33680 [Nostoc sp.]